jgi:hypothetical protein
VGLGRGGGELVGGHWRGSFWKVETLAGDGNGRIGGSSIRFGGGCGDLKAVAWRGLAWLGWCVLVIEDLVGCCGGFKKGKCEAMAIDNETARGIIDRLVVAPTLLIIRSGGGESSMIRFVRFDQSFSSLSLASFEFEFQRSDQIVQRQQIEMVGNLDKCE